MRESREVVIENQEYITGNELSDWEIIPVEDLTKLHGYSNNQIKPNTNTLEELFDYLIKEKSGNPIPFRNADILSLFLELLGGTGGIYSWPPALAYAKGKQPWLVYSFAITNPLSNVLFLMKASDDLFDTIQRELQVPVELNELIEIPTKKELVVKYLKMSVGSVLCIAPFAAVAYLFPLPKCTETWCLSLTVTHSILTNLILHAVAWNIILTPDFWYYRLPVWPFEKLYHKIVNLFNSEFDLENLRLTQEQQIIYDKYKKLLIEDFSSASMRLIQQYLSKEDSAADHLRSLQRDDMSFANFSSLGHIEEIADETPQSNLGWILNNVNWLLSNGVMGLLGGSIMVTGCIGWIANPFYIGYLANLTLPVMISAGSLPSYSTGVLCAFYGSAILNKIYNYMTTWNGIQDKFSPEARMYPKTFAVFLLFNLYVSFFAYATGAQLIRIIFADERWDGYREALEGISIPTLQVLSFIPLVDLFNLFIRKVKAKCGNLEDDDTLAARLLLKSSIIPEYIQQMKGEELMASFQQYSSEELSSLGLEVEELEKDIGTLKKLKEEKFSLYSSYGKRNLLFSQNHSVQSESGPLLERQRSKTLTI